MPRLRIHLVLLWLGAALLTAAPPVAGAARPQLVIPHVRVDGISIGYRIVGHGRPLVLIPGYGVTMFDWDPKLVGALSARHRVVLFDNRGVATSTTRGRTVTIAQMARDTAGLIRALHLGRPDVLGWSMGGYIAQDLVLAHPLMVHRLILASTDFGGSGAIPPTKAAREDLRSTNYKVQLKALFPPKAITAGYAWYTRVGKQAKKLGVPKRYLVASPKITGEQFRAADTWEKPGHGTYSGLPKLHTRTLIAAGVQDIVVPVGNARLLHGRIRSSKLVLYGGAGHAFLFQTPRSVAQRFNRFLG